MSALERFRVKVKGWLDGGTEGSWRGPFFGQGELGGWHELGPLEDGYQRNLNVDGFTARRIPACYAAVMASARAVSQCYPEHKRVSPTGRVEIVRTSSASRVLTRPNSYESWPQFILNMVASMQFDGNAYAVAARNDRDEVVALHRMGRGTCEPYVAEDASIYYSIGSNPLVPDLVDYMAPQRDVLHLRMHTPRHPLIGESPIAAAAMAAGVNVALSRSQLAFFARMNRPSGVLSTDKELRGEQLDLLRTKFAEQSKAWAQGGLPVLSHGLKFQTVSISSQDAQLVEAQRMSIEDIARVYGVPLPVVGDLTHATLQNVEQLVNLWLSVSLGALIENIERSLDALFEMPRTAERNEFVELDTAALLRLDFSGRIDALVKGVQGALYTPDEARAREGLPPVKNGGVPYMQQQMVPLGYRPEVAAPAPAPAPVSTDPVQPGAAQEEGEKPETDDAKSFGDVDEDEVALYLRAVIVDEMAKLEPEAA